MMNDISSTAPANVANDMFLFIYELEPSALCSNFRHDSAPFGRSAPPPLGVQFSAWQDMLAVYYATVKGAYQFEAISNHAHSTVTSIIASYAFFTGKPLRFTRRNWIEYQGSLTNIVIGKSEGIGYPDPNHKDNRPFKELNNLMPLILNNAALAAALDDFYSCSSRTDPDFYFYAYRAVEDVRAHFGSSGEDKERVKAWNSMNEALNRKEEDYDELKRFAEKYRHANVLGESIDRENAERQVLFVHSLIADFVKYLESKAKAPEVVASQPTVLDSPQKLT
jgi:hypothetical protein